MTDYHDEFVRITEIVSLVCGYDGTRSRNAAPWEMLEAFDENETPDAADDFAGSPCGDDSAGESFAYDVFRNGDAEPEGFSDPAHIDFPVGMTIASLAEKMHCTLRQMRSDIDALLEQDIIAMWVGGQKITHLNEKSAAYDAVPLFPGNRLPDGFGLDLLFLNEPEYKLYRGKSDDIFVKDSPFSHAAEEKGNINIIEEAIKNEKPIYFRYHSPSEAAYRNVTILPRLIYHDLTNEQYYCIAVNEEKQILAYRLDRILYGVQKIETDDTAGELDAAVQRQIDAAGELDAAAQRRIDAAWGADFSHDETPVHVKVRLTAGTRNVAGKFKADISGRKLGTLKKAGTENGKDVYIYEDEIIGESAFRSWLRRYGSAVKVLEPKSMAEAMRKNALRAKWNYENGRLLSDAEFEKMMENT